MTIASPMSIAPQVVPPLDPDFRPAVLANQAFRTAIRASGEATTLRIGLRRPSGAISTYQTIVFADGSPQAAANLQYVERLVKFLLWQRGASTVLIAGSKDVADHLQQVYSLDGARAFDVDFMTRVYETPFTVQFVEVVPDTEEPSVSLGRHLEGNRIGFDLGASDYKISAVVDGEAVYADEFPWMPRDATELSYHYEHITAGLRKAAKQMPSVDAIGGSSAGVWIDDRVRVASLFRGLSREEFDSAATDLFVRIRNEWGVPLNVVNDGEVTALAGSMSLEANAVLGVAMGSSEAAGYVTPDGTITRWLNELAFAPFDYQDKAPADEWSGDVGCGVQYFCQTGVVRLAGRAGIDFDPTLTPAQKLVVVQELMADGDERVPAIYETIGVWFGYALAHYADFYQIDHVLVLGRVTSGRGGEIIVDRARKVLATQFPELAMELHVPDEQMKRVGQSVAAASLPEIDMEAK
jgi:predicted NBD/HSP70 family sugar kinase